MISHCGIPSCFLFPRRPDGKIVLPVPDTNRAMREGVKPCACRNRGRKTKGTSQNHILNEKEGGLFPPVDAVNIDSDQTSLSMGQGEQDPKSYETVPTSVTTKDPHPETTIDTKYDDLLFLKYRERKSFVPRTRRQVYSADDTSMSPFRIYTVKRPAKK
ncbi:hypothetical protein GALMADRAFT_1162660 [Galerina marginata CBS 339.88]|uniref:Uncharacterized protein n=1 Tax=Galerina marginata (strain CBS 339.88) TaxID=685588 RepID=A0A067S670_GALM3|nr:hypothetical protein GALMADRAFT_1162660 [Galerina marginata CBS 339.88]